MTASVAVDKNINGICAGVADGSIPTRNNSVMAMTDGSQGLHCRPRSAIMNRPIAAEARMVMMTASPMPNTAGSGVATIDGTLKPWTIAARGKRAAIISRAPS